MLKNLELSDRIRLRTSKLLSDIWLLQMHIITVSVYAMLKAESTFLQVAHKIKILLALLLILEY